MNSFYTNRTGKICVCSFMEIRYCEQYFPTFAFVNTIWSTNHLTRQSHSYRDKYRTPRRSHLSQHSCTPRCIAPDSLFEQCTDELWYLPHHLFYLGDSGAHAMTLVHSDVFIPHCFSALAVGG